MDDFDQLFKIVQGVKTRILNTIKWRRRHLRRVLYGTN